MLNKKTIYCMFSGLVIAAAILLAGCSLFEEDKPANKTDKKTTKTTKKKEDPSGVYSDLNQTEQEALKEYYNKAEKDRALRSKKVFGGILP